MLVDPSLDTPLATVRLTQADASVVAALLTGTRFRIEYPEALVAGRREPDHTIVEVLDIRTGSPAVGRPPEDVFRELGLDAALLCVTRDQIPAVEANERRSIEAGDKLIIAVRPSQLDSVRSAV